jgi:hypothetical protein
MNDSIAKFNSLNYRKKKVIKNSKKTNKIVLLFYDISKKIHK